MQIKDLIPWGRSKENSLPAQADSNDSISVLQRDINRMFDDFWTNAHRPFGNLIQSTSPSTDVSETDEAIEVTVELPGIDEKDVDVTLSGDTLTIRGEKKAESKEKRKGYYVSERSYGSFARTIPLPPGIDADKAVADFKRGVLTVRLPKSAEARANVKRIDVKTA